MSDLFIKWSEFEAKRLFWQKIWKESKNNAEPALRKFMDKSYLVICYPREDDERSDLGITQIPFDVTPEKIVMEHNSFLENNEDGKQLMKLWATYQKLDKISLFRRTPAQVKERDLIREQMTTFNPSGLRLVRMEAQARFPTMDINQIRAIKHLPFCDQARTNMTNVSIRVFLKDD